MTNVMTVCGAGICIVIAITLIRELRKEYTFLLILLASVLFAIAVLPSIRESVDFMLEVAATTNVELLKLVIRALGITFLTSIAGEICRSAGEATVGGYIEMVGRAEILVLCIPLFRELLEMALL